jgi:hypothetical protein
MVLGEVTAIGWKASDFALKGVDAAPKDAAVNETSASTLPKAVAEPSVKTTANIVPLTSRSIWPAAEARR